MARDYIPRKADNFNIFQGNLAKAVSANAAAWKIPADEVTTLTGSSAQYTKLYEATSNIPNRTHVDAVKHTDFRNDFEKYLRHFVNAYIRSNKLIDDPAKSALGIKVRGKRRGHLTQIDDTVLLILEPMGGALMRVRCRVPSAEGKPRLHHQAHGVEIAFSVGTQPAHPDAAEKRVIKKRAQFLLHLAENQRGQMLYAFARWVNLTNEELSGPWNKVKMEFLY